MAISIATGPWHGRYPDDRTAVAALLEVVHRLLTENVTQDIREQYAELRELLLNNPEYADVVPTSLRKSRTAEEFRSQLASVNQNNVEGAATAMAQLRDVVVRADELSVPEVLETSSAANEPNVGRSVLDLEEATETHPLVAQDLVTGPPEMSRPTLEVHDAQSASNADNVQLNTGYGRSYGMSYGGQDAAPASRPLASAETWTGIPSRATRLIAVRGQIGAAYEAVQYLIDDLSVEEGNGGPLLEEHSNALEALRDLHRTLGQLLSAIDHGILNDEMGEGFAAEVARFGGDWIASLGDNRGRYFTALMTFTTLTACGLADLGGLVGGAMLNIPKRRPKRNGAG